MTWLKKSRSNLSRKSAAYRPDPFIRNVVGSGLRSVSMNASHSSGGTIPYAQPVHCCELCQHNARSSSIAN